MVCGVAILCTCMGIKMPFLNWACVSGWGLTFFSPFFTSYHRINQLWHVLLFPLSSFLYLKHQHFKTFNIRQTFSWRNNVFYLLSFVGGIWKAQWSREGRNKYKLRDLRLPNLICSRELRPPLFPKSCVAWRMNGCWSIVLTAHRGLFTMFSILI